MQNLKAFDYFQHQRRRLRAGEMVQQLRILIAIPEDGVGFSSHHAHSGSKLQRSFMLCPFMSAFGNTCP